MEEKSGEEEVASIVCYRACTAFSCLTSFRWSGFAFTSVVIELTVPGKKTSQTSNKSSSGFNDHDIRAR